MPSYGGRLQWKCIVTIKETIASTTNQTKTKPKNNNNNKKKKNDETQKKSPYFCWNARGQLELAAWPFMMEKIPNPPHFPGYYKNGAVRARSSSSNKRSSSSTDSKNNKDTKIQNLSAPQCPNENNIRLQSPHSDDVVQTPGTLTTPDTVAMNGVDDTIGRDDNPTTVTNLIVDPVVPDGNNDSKMTIDVDVAPPDNEIEKEDDEEEEEADEEEWLSEEMKQLRELQERAVTGLAELAYEERWRVSIPTIHYKWISPLQQTFYTRKSAWDHAIELCKNDVLLDKVLRGYGANGKTILPKLPTQSATFNAGKLRFIRDGLWIIGQEEQWIHDRMTQEQNDSKVDGACDSWIVDQIDGALNQPNDKMTSVDTSASNIVELKPPQQQRPWTGVSLFINETRIQHRDNRIMEISQEPTTHAISPSPSKGKNSDTDSSTSSLSTYTIEPATPIALNPVTTITTDGKPSVILETPTLKGNSKPLDRNDVPTYTLVEATKELRALWKSMTEDEKNKWNNNAKIKNALGLKPALSSVSIHPTSSSAESLPVGNAKQASTKTKPVNVQRSKKWSLNEQQIQLCYDAGMEHYDQIMRTVTARDLFRELEDGFDLLRERGKGRWDMNLPEFETNSFAFLNDINKTPWMPVVREILGKDVVLIHKGIFLSMPGSSKQVYHQDGPHLTTQYQKPCHAINVFVPLVDLVLDNGPTEFCLGSHILGYDGLDEDFVTTPTVSAGQPIIFDYRLGHRGLGNSSTSCRPIVYCTYAASADGKEFRDSVNFSRKRYHRIGDLVEKGLTRAERAEKRQRT